MFLKFFKLKKKYFTSPASRNTYKFFLRLTYLNKFKHLSLSPLSNAGRNNSGRIVCWTKTSFLKKKKSIRINYNLRYLKLGFVANFHIIPFKNKILSLIFFSNGFVSYFLTNDRHKLFSYNYFHSIKIFKKLKIKNTFFNLFYFKKPTYVSMLEILPGIGAQYVRSPGTRARLIRHDTTTHSSLVQLPSGHKKLFSYYTFVFLGRIASSLHKNALNGKAGYWRSFGVKPIVRGVAMNPVDHPHGGRTKAIKYPRTPWGKTTKFK